MAARPLWDREVPSDLRDWSLFVGDLRDELGRRGLRGVIGVGHSLGAVTSLLAAVADPGLFSAVVAVDPLILTGPRSLFWRTAKAIGLGGRLGIVRGARRRRNLWSNRAEARAAYSRKKVFAGWDPEVLDDYLECGMIDLSSGEVYLRYPKEWEARIFKAAPHDLWERLLKLTIPCLFVQGEESDTFLDAARARVEREIPTARTVVVAGTSHFLPMEKPAELARVIGDFLHRIRDANDGGSPRHQGGSR
jgi:pimeloyl-ACP methyl ester carboxylesterase